MATTIAAKIVRSIAGNEATIFNDKLKDGTRSFKVRHWRDPRGNGWEIKAARQLAAMGFKAKIVTTCDGEKRLHVAV